MEDFDQEFETIEAPEETDYFDIDYDENEDDFDYDEYGAEDDYFVEPDEYFDEDAAIERDEARYEAWIYGE